MSATAAIQLRAPQLRPASFKRADYARTSWVADIPYGVSFEQILVPEYWAHIASQLRDPNRGKNGWGDLIEVYPEDMSYYAVLFVRDCGAAWAKVAIVMKVDFEDATDDVPVDSGHEVKFMGRTMKHAVVRTSDKQIMAHSFNTKAEAEIALIKMVEKQTA